jgi:hypothetical protein
MLIWNDEILHEIHAFRLEHGRQFDYDIHRIVQDIQRQEHESTRPFATIPVQKRKPKQPVGTDETIVQD